jgi:NADPH-dependent 2,4-dienoyl-CoA reductase/sulfur reductase-like enzyme
MLRKNVTLFEMTNEIGIDLAVVPKPRMLNRLLKLGVDMRKNAMVTEINENNVKFEQDGKILTLDHVDTVVIAVGMKKNDSLVKLLITEGIPCYTVGDAGNVARLMQALESAYQILQEI